MLYDILVVGGGVAGLTAAAYGARAGHSVLVCEQQPSVGGHVNSFERNGFVFDQGIRSIENSGIIFPMLKQLGIELEFVRSAVSLGVADDMIAVDTPQSLADYEALLCRLFPENKKDITRIVQEIRKIMGYMDILYGIENPLFLESYNMSYMVSTLLPWMFRYLRSMPKVSRLHEPVNTYLQRFTDNQSLIDIIAQHFFKETPTFFALSYFSLYLDYNYPKGGTKAFPQALLKFIQTHGGEVKTDTTIAHLDPIRHTVVDRNGLEYEYRQLVWAADMKSLYASIDYEGLADKRLRNTLLMRKSELLDKRGGDSIFTLYLSVDLPLEYFTSITSAHLFYTPSRPGLSQIASEELRELISSPAEKLQGEGKLVVQRWLHQYFTYTTYEISIPAMRDDTMAPEGKTALIISTLFDYDIARYVADAHWYDEFKTYCNDRNTFQHGIPRIGCIYH
jgi:phytoene dehydrogenase-like protein